MEQEHHLQCSTIWTFRQPLYTPVVSRIVTIWLILSCQIKSTLSIAILKFNGRAWLKFPSSRIRCHHFSTGCCIFHGCLIIKTTLECTNSTNKSCRCTAISALWNQKSFIDSKFTDFGPKTWESFNWDGKFCSSHFYCFLSRFCGLPDRPTLRGSSVWKRASASRAASSFKRCSLKWASGRSEVLPSRGNSGNVQRAPTS